MNRLRDSIREFARALRDDRLSDPGASISSLLAPRSTDEPIAIVGVGCRFPGADGPEAFWHLLRDGVDAVREALKAR